jgi:hypothetical protein|tara:strand:+ start:394 stop:663 length:270 start_codon:yes stop_codon:yes gene_type:complete
MSDGFDFEFKSSKTTHKFLRKGQGKRMSNRYEGLNRNFLRKGQGKLVSENHGETEFSKKRQRSVIDEQFDREEMHRINKENKETKNNKK